MGNAHNYASLHQDGKKTPICASMQVFYHLGELDDALSYALGAGKLFDINEPSEYVQSTLGKQTLTSLRSLGLCACPCPASCIQSTQEVCLMHLCLQTSV